MTGGLSVSIVYSGGFTENPRDERLNQHSLSPGSFFAHGQKTEFDTGGLHSHERSQASRATLLAMN